MAYIKTLKENELIGGSSNTPVYPRTSTQAIYSQTPGGSTPSGVKQLLEDRLQDIEKDIEDLEQRPSGNSTIISVTYAELVQLRDTSKLLPAQWYRITDYVASTSELYTQSANHPFDILVMAIDTDKLSEDAYAARNEEDRYFPEETVFEAWKLKYCLDNNYHRFYWADSNGKGVVYYLRDENGNEAPFDFKGITFYRWKVSDSQLRTNIDGKYVGILGNLSDSNQSIPDEADYVEYYLFSGHYNDEDDPEDLSINGSLCYNNKVAAQYISNSGLSQGLNNNALTIIDETGTLHDNMVLGNDFKNNTIRAKSIERNTFSGNNINQNTISGDSVYANVLSGSSIERNTFANNLDSITLSGNRFRDNSSRVKMQACVFQYPTSSCTFNVFTSGQIFKCVQTVGQLSSQSVMVTGNSAVAICVGINSNSELIIWKPADQVYS